jgi:hypothetical protein
VSELEHKGDDDKAVFSIRAHFEPPFDAGNGGQRLILATPKPAREKRIEDKGWRPLVPDTSLDSVLITL